MNATLRAVGASVIAALILTGCVRVESDVEVFSDDTVSQTAEMAVERAVLELGGGDSDSALTELVGSIEEVRSVYDEVGLDVVVQEINTEDEVGLRISSERQPLELVNDPRLSEGSAVPAATIERIDDTFRIVIQGAAIDEIAGESEMSLDQLALFMTLRSSFTFPGEIIESNGGTIEGNTITFTIADLAGGEDLYAVAKADGSTSLPIWIWIGLALLLLAAIATFLLTRGRQSKAVPLNAPPPIAPPAMAPPVAGTPASTASTPQSKAKAPKQGAAD